MLLRTEGMEPAALSEKEKLHFLERMVPLVEHNYNLCELGPRGTGKSHLYKEISPYSILISGGQNHRRQPVLFSVACSASAWSAIGIASPSTRWRACTSANTGRYPDHEGLHGLRLLRPRARSDQRGRIHGIRGQHQRYGAESAQDHASVQPLPAGIQQRQRVLSTACITTCRAGKSPSCAPSC